MFSIFADGPGRFRFEDDRGAEVGWIRGRAIGFSGIHDESGAMVAASIGWRALQSLLRREDATLSRDEVDWQHLRLVHDGAYEWVSDGRVPLARLLRSSDTECDGHDGIAGAARPPCRLALEFVVPAWVADHSMIPFADALRHVLAPLLWNASRATAARAPRLPVPGRESPAHSPAPTAVDGLLVG
jgi:hypothetical protein